MQARKISVPKHDYMLAYYASMLMSIKSLEVDKGYLFRVGAVRIHARNPLLRRSTETIGLKDDAAVRQIVGVIAIHPIGGSDP